MIIIGTDEVLDILGEERCWKFVAGLYTCAVDFLLVKGFTLVENADNLFAVVGGLPVMDVRCDRWLMYYGFSKLFVGRFVIEGWRTVESDDAIIVYSCVGDPFEYYEAEEYILRRVPLSVFGFGSVDIYNRLISLPREQILYTLRNYY